MEYSHRNTIRTVIACAGVMLSCVAARGGLVIDDFSDVASPNPWPVTVTSPNVIEVFETGLSGVIGGTRSTTLSGLLFDLAGLDEVRTDIVAGAGQLDYTSSVGATANLQISYLDNSVADLSGDALIQIDFTGFDLGTETPMPVTITLFSGPASASLTQMLINPGAQSVAFNFADFANVEAIDLGSVDEMLFEFEPGESGDFRIIEIATVVPEPTTLVMLLAGVGAIVRRRRVSRHPSGSPGADPITPAT